MKNFKNHRAIWVIVFCMGSVACNMSPQAANSVNSKRIQMQVLDLEKVWQLIDLETVSGTTPAYPGATLSLQQGKISGNGTCNNYAGSYRVQGKQLSIALSRLSMMACAEPERMVQEQRYFELLGQVVSYQLMGEKLQLLNAQGKTLLQFSIAKQK